MVQVQLDAAWFLKVVRRSGDIEVLLSIHTEERGLTEAEADVIDAAITAANAQSEIEFPDDGTMFSSATLLETQVVTAVIEGSVPTQVERWLEIFVAGLTTAEGLPDSLVVRKAKLRRAPDLLALGEKHFPDQLKPTANLCFVPVSHARDDQYLRPETWDLVKEILPGWAGPGTGHSVVDFGGPGAELAARGPLWSLFNRRPPTPHTIRKIAVYDDRVDLARMFVLYLRGTGAAQVASNCDVLTDYHEILDLLRILSQHLNYAYVRRGRPLYPQGDRPAWGPKPTYGEGGVKAGDSWLFSEYIADAAVAQVLTDKALAKIHDTNGFDLEP